MENLGERLFNYITNIIAQNIELNPVPLYIALIVFLLLKYRREAKEWLSDIKSFCKNLIVNLILILEIWNIKLKKVPEKLHKDAPITDFYAKLDAAQIAVDPKVPEGEVKVINKKGRKGNTLRVLMVNQKSPKEVINALKKGYIKGLAIRKEMISVFKDHEGLGESLEIAFLELLIKVIVIKPFVEMEYLKFIEEAFADKRVYRYYNLWIQLNNWLRKNRIDLSKLNPSHIQLILLASIAYYNNVGEI